MCSFSCSFLLWFITYFVRLVTQSCLTLCNPIDYSPPGSSVHGDSPGKHTGVVAMPLSRGFSQPGVYHRILNIAIYAIQ